MRSEMGFSLIELVITIAILSTLSAIAILYTPGILDNFKVRGAARQIYSDMQMARLAAIKGGRVWCVIFSGSPFTSYTIVDAGTNGVCDVGVDIVNAAGEKTVDNLASQYSGVSMTHNFSANTLNFNPNGTAEGGTATITKGSRTMDIIVNQSTGNIRIE